MKRKIVRKECDSMSTSTRISHSTANLEVLEANFDKLLSSNRDFIHSITPLNPSISKDDEWNDPVYDNYAINDDNGDYE